MTTDGNGTGDGRTPPRVPLLRAMTGRDADEPNRVSTPLELLFDLTFVIAVGRAAAELAHDLLAGNTGHALVGYLTVFFAIWWAWVNFTWFASAYDTDDVVYRLLTMVQMAGVLVLAAGVPAAFKDHFLTVVIGYVLMRLALLTQWLRAAHADPGHRRTALRYVAGIGAIQVLWIARLAIDGSYSLAVASFIVLALAEMAVPWWAERPNMTTWHPHHIAERYGLFTIIVLGEVVLAASNAVQNGVSESGVSADLVLVGVAALVLLFALWWLYFLREAGDDLANAQSLSFYFGYVHYGIFGAIAAVGAGLDVAVETLGEHVEISATAAAFAVAVPVSSYLLVLYGLRRRFLHYPLPPLAGVLITVAATLVLAALADRIGIAASIVLQSVVCALLVAFSLYRKRFHVQTAGT
ncbi:MAG: Low temperature requirement protein [Frankiales bacterium]|nr:Low temperature requirement protein [Frankiales bacterium]